MQRESGPEWRFFAVAAGVLGTVMVAVYIAILFGVEDNNSIAEALPWILAMVLPATGAFASVMTDDRRRARAMLIGAAVLFVLLGMLSIFTIGLGFLAASALAGVGAIRLSATDSDQ